MERALKAGGLAIAVVGLLVLVAIAARGTHPGTNGDVATRAVPNSVQDAFITLLVIVYAVAIVAIIVGLHRYPNRFREPPSRWLLNFALILVLMLVASGAGYYAISHGYGRSHRDQPQGAAVGRPTPPNGGFRSRAVPAREAQFQWPLALGIAGLVLLGGIWIYVRRRRELVPSGKTSLEADLVAAIETTIDDLRNERDARRAVIAAYALMEHTLTVHGLPRHRAETPFEYLGRILRALNVREAAVATLTSLFEYAKFSRHDIDAAMKEEAIDALVAVRDDLQREEAVAA